MNKVRKDSLKALAGAVKGGSRDDAAESFEELTKRFFASSDKAERERLLADFAAKRSELADFIESNPELLKAELERAVLMAAVGGRSEETEISVDSRGRRTVKRSIKQTAPNAAAAFRYLEKAVPEIWGDNASGKAPENNLLEILRAGLSGSSEVEEKESDGEG